MGLRWSETKRFVRPQVGEMDLCCRLLLDRGDGLASSMACKCGGGTPCWRYASRR
ncbi:hypothetical protein [Streptomyces sp. Amel2xC10]|uniref:hypothetical protein n=1 Tax=Streptomyces sp. Amel2xC10 TaxID=1305826 RepID=UPI00356652B2